MIVVFYEGVTIQINNKSVALQPIEGQGRKPTDLTSNNSQTEEEGHPASLGVKRY